MVRQNILYGAKQSAQSYDEHIGKELGCDGFEVDAHSGCRPSHEFMQGKMYSYKGRKVIDGIVYEDGSEALARLKDYGCLHFKIDVILGVSVPRYSAAELERIHKETTELIEYDGKEKTLYEWKQTQRRFERAVRNEQQKADMFEAAGMKRKAGDCKDRIKVYRSTYDDMCKNVKGLEPRLNRMRSYKSIDISDKSGIIKEKDINIFKSVGAAGKNYPVKLPNGNHSKLAEGTKITKVKVIMGYGTDTELRDRFYLEREYGISADKWQKVRGEGIVVFNNENRIAEVHWYEAEGQREKMKIKRWLDES